MKITYFNSQIPHKFYGQFHDNEKIVLDLLCDLNGEVGNQTELTETVKNTLCSVKFEDIWWVSVVCCNILIMIVTGTELLYCIGDGQESILSNCWTMAIG